MTKLTASKTKIMVFGVFDFLHPGHINFLKQAKRLGDYLVVSVAREANILMFKGRLPVFSEKDRVEMLKVLDFVDEVVLGGVENPWNHIKEAKPDIIALGYDQKPYLATDVKGLVRQLRDRNLNTKVIRLKGYKSNSYKSGNFRLLDGVVKKGKGRGKKFGFPTANISCNFKLPEGIYAAFTHVNGKILPSIAFLGPPKTFDETRKMNVESYILNFDENIYGEKIRVELLRKLRDNERFPSTKNLITQMKKDKRLAQRFFRMLQWT